MSYKKKFLTNSVFHVLKIIELMKQPKGINIEEISKELRITRRSVFRLLNTIENNLCIPFTIIRNTFGGISSYHLSSDYIDKLSNVKMPELQLSFYQAVFVDLLFKSILFPKSNIISKEIEQLRKQILDCYPQS